MPDHYVSMVGDIFRGIGKRRRDPIEPLDRDALYARLGLPPAPRQPAEVGAYLRIDGPRPAQPRTWRALAEESGR